MKKHRTDSVVSKIVKEIELVNAKSQASMNKLGRDPHKSLALPQIDRDEIKKQMRERYRQKWRDSGYVNTEFEKLSILKAKILNTWQQERVNLSKRSYECPKDFKGMKTVSHGGFFPKPDPQKLPAKVRDYIQKCEHDYKQAMYDPTATLKSYDSMVLKVKQGYKNAFRRTNTVQNNAFGHSRTTMKSLSSSQF